MASSGVEANLLPSGRMGRHGGAHATHAVQPHLGTTGDDANAARSYLRPIVPCRPARGARWQADVEDHEDSRREGHLGSADAVGGHRRCRNEQIEARKVSAARSDDARGVSDAIFIEFRRGLPGIRNKTVVSAPRSRPSCNQSPASASGAPANRNHGRFSKPAERRGARVRLAVSLSGRMH